MEGDEGDDSVQKSGDGVSGAKKLIRHLDFNVESGGQAPVVPIRAPVAPVIPQPNPVRAAVGSSSVGVPSQVAMPSPSGTSMLQNAKIQLPVRPVV